MGFVPSSSEPPADKLENHDLLREVVRARSRSAERQRDADIPLRSSSRLHQSKDGDRSGRSAHGSVVDTRAVKSGVDSASWTSSEARLAESKRMRESSGRAKGSSATSAVGSKVDRPNPTGGACVSNLLKTNFLSSSSPCAELVNHVHQAGELGTLSSLSLEKQREATLHLLPS